jgi:hypothetical protein
MSALALIVPSSMSAVTGLTKDGRESKHTLANTGPCRFLICELLENRMMQGNGQETARGNESRPRDKFFV